MKKILNSVALFLCIGSAVAQNKTAVRPKLVIGIVVDQMRWDYLYRYEERYGNKGFRRLLNKGFSFQNTFLNYVPSYTAPGHATIYSGAVPAVHGIVGNDWIEAKTYQKRYCAQDDEVKGTGGSQQAGKMSPRQMKSNTIGDELRLASNFRSRVYGIALKDRGAIFPSGHLSNGAFWFDDSTGNFMSSSYYYNTQLPEWLIRFNNKKWPDTLLTKSWNTYYPIESYTQSITDDNNYEYLKKEESTPTFPHNTGSKAYKNIRSLPAGNTLTFKLAKTLIRSEHLGQQGETDMLTVSLSSTDYIGHAYAPNSIEVEDTYLRLDRDLGDFLHFLDQEIGPENYLLFLSADHGGAHNASFLKDHNVPAGLLSEYELRDDLNRKVKRTFGQDSLVQVMNYQILLNESLIEKNKINRESLKTFLIKTAKQYPGIASVADIENLYKETLPDFLKKAIENGYYAPRSGSIALIYEPAWYSDGPKGTTHGTWNPYDTHIPLLWYGWHIPEGESFQKTEVTDIAATLAALLHIQMPNGTNGSVIFSAQVLKSGTR